MSSAVIKIRFHSEVVDRESDSFTWRTELHINMKELLLFEIISNNFVIINYTKHTGRVMLVSESILNFE